MHKYIQALFKYVIANTIVYIRMASTLTMSYILDKIYIHDKYT